MDNLFIFIQARSTSTRLPNKVIKPFTDNNTTILNHLHNRVEKVYPREKIYFLIPEKDTTLRDYLKSQKYNFFEGDEENVRDRFIKAGNFLKANKIIRITGDNPFIDIVHLELLIEALLRSDADLISFSRLPLGMGAEGFTLDSISSDSRFILKDYHNEHVSLHIKENPLEFKIFRLKPLVDIDDDILSNIRVTIDEESDFEVCINIYNIINNFYFGITELIELYKNHQEIFKVNKNVRQITFSLPTLEKKQSKKITIFYGNTTSYGSGHYERCKILYVILQAEGYEVEISDKEPFFNNSDLYIIDARDFEIKRDLMNSKILLIDNFGNKNLEVLNFYSLPHPNYSSDLIKDNLLFPALIEYYKYSKNNINKNILIYAGNLNSDYSERLDSFCLKYFTDYKLIRIGGKPPTENVEWFSRLSKKEFLERLNVSYAFVSYFGQAIMEALYLNKEIILYSISDYHELLSKNLSTSFSIINIGNIQNLNYNHIKIKDNNIVISNNGFSNLKNYISDILNK